MITKQDLTVQYKQETGLEPIITAYGFRPYLAWLEEKLLKELNGTCPKCGDTGDTELPSER